MMQHGYRELIRWLIYTPILCKMQWREAFFCYSLVARCRYTGSHFRLRYVSIYDIFGGQNLGIQKKACLQQQALNPKGPSPAFHCDTQSDRSRQIWKSSGGWLLLAFLVICKRYLAFSWLGDSGVNRNSHASCRHRSIEAGDKHPQHHGLALS